MDIKVIETLASNPEWETAWKHREKEWENQRKARAHSDKHGVPTINHIIARVGDDEFIKGLQDKAMASLYYLTAARSSEIVGLDGPKREPGFRLGKKRSRTGITKESIDFEYLNGRRVMRIRLPNRKAKKKPYKELMLAADNKNEGILIKHVYKYHKRLPSKAIMFDYSNSYIRYWFPKAFGFNCHFMRHIRATHLVTMYNFPIHLLMRFMGWTTMRSARHYMELRSEDFLKFLPPTEEEGGEQ